MARNKALPVAKLDSARLAAALRQSLLGHLDVPCMAVRKAVDLLAKDFSAGRQGLLEWLSREAANPSPAWSGLSPVAFLMEVWVNQKDLALQLATGRGRDEWLALVS